MQGKQQTLRKDEKMAKAKKMAKKISKTNCWNFGKYKGEPLNGISQGPYVAWALRNVELSAEEKEVLSAELSTFNSAFTALKAELKVLGASLKSTNVVLIKEKTPELTALVKSTVRRSPIGEHIEVL